MILVLWELCAHSTSSSTKKGISATFSKRTKKLRTKRCAKHVYKLQEWAQESGTSITKIELHPPRSKATFLSKFNKIWILFLCLFLTSTQLKILVKAPPAFVADPDR